MRCAAVGRRQAELTDAAFIDEGCVQLAPHSDNLKLQARTFADWCEDEKIDIVFGVNSPAILSALAHLPAKIRALARCANGFDEGYRLTLIGRERLARIVALVPRLRDDLVNDYGADPSRIVLIPNGTSPERFAQAASKTRGAGDRLELGFLGRLEHNQKGVLHLPDVLRDLDRKRVSYRLTIAGRGRDESQLRNALRQHLDRGHVRFAGSLSPAQIADFLAEIDVFLFPSHFEGCPNALLEAMTAGATPVAWRLPGITDFLIDDGKTGLLAETGDTAWFANHIADLAEDHDRLAAMSRATSEAARARFSRDTCANAYAELFSKVMAEPPPQWEPAPWTQFKVNPMFRRRLLSRILPAPQRQALRSFAETLRGRKATTPAHAHSAAGGLRVHQIINSCDLKLGGAERIARALHENLRAAGVESHLVSLQAFAEGDAPEGAVSLGLKSPYDPRALTRLAAYANQIGPGDIVHAHLFPASAHVAALARAGRLSAPLVFTEHSTSNRRRSHPLGGLVDRQIYAAFDRIVAISQGVQSELLRSQPWINGNTTVIHNGCRLLFDAPTARERQQEPFQLLSVGRLTPAKNYGVALEAIASLAPREIRYVIAGDGPELQPLQEKAASLGIARRVEFAGYVPDIRELLRAADIFLIPSAWEGFGLAAVEAMNASLPVIASDVPGLREVVGADAKAAILVDPGKPEAIAEAIRRLLDEPDTRRALGRSGYERARAFDMEAFLHGHLRLYKGLKGRAAHET